MPAASALAKMNGELLPSVNALKPALVNAALFKSVRRDKPLSDGVFFDVTATSQICFF